MKKSIRIKSFFFALITMLSFSISCVFDSQPQEVYGTSIIGYYLYEAYLIILTELGIQVNDADYAYTGEKIARDKKKLVKKFDDGFEKAMAMQELYQWTIEHTCKEVWDNRTFIVDKFKEQISKATTGAYELSSDVAHALEYYGELLRSKLGYDDYDIATKYAAASNEDWEIITKGGKLTQSSIARICNVPGYMFDKFDKLNFGSYLTTNDEVSIYTSSNATESYYGYFFVQHRMTDYFGGVYKSLPCEIVVNDLDDSKYYQALLRHCVYNGTNYYQGCSSYTLSIYAKGYFQAKEDYKCDFSGNTYMAKTEIPDLVWNSKVGVRSRDGYVSAKAIPDSALGDVYTKAGDIPKILSRPHDLTRLNQAIAEILARVKAGELTWAQAMELIKAITQAQENTADRAETTEREDTTERTDEDTTERTDEDTDINNPNMEFDLKSLFPFCIPFDLLALVKLLNADPVAPKFEIPLKLGTWIDYTLVIDLTSLGALSTVLRVGIIIFWVCGLMVVTSKLIKW